MKERLVGATVLVAFIVLVVPVFLDGPSDANEVVTREVALPGQDGQQRERQTIVLERDRSEPVPLTPSASTPTPEPAAPASATPQRSTPAVTEPEPAPAVTTASEPPPARAEEAPAAASATGLFAVQLGSFSNKTNAERLVRDLQGQGFAAFLSRVSSGGQDLHRVRIGPQKDREAAEKVAAQLASAGHRGQVVPHP